MVRFIDVDDIVRVNELLFLLFGVTANGRVCFCRMVLVVGLALVRYDAGCARGAPPAALRPLDFDFNPQSAR